MNEETPETTSKNLTIPQPHVLDEEIQYEKENETVVESDNEPLDDCETDDSEDNQQIPQHEDADAIHNVSRPRKRIRNVNKWKATEIKKKAVVICSREGQTIPQPMFREGYLLNSTCLENYHL